MLKNCANYDMHVDEMVTIEENEYNDEEFNNSIITPFDPNKVDIESKPMTVRNIVEDIDYKMIDMSPDFQRSNECWNAKRKSRLIESLILSIPLPSFYFDVIDDDKLEIVDGLQRITAIYEYISGKFCLSELEYLEKFNNKFFADLEVKYQRKIFGVNFNCYIIRKNTPDNVKNSIFTRLNTGGEPLTPAEIKNAMFRGQASNFIKEMANTEIFKKVTRNKIMPKRMLDREFVNRFFALYFCKINSKYLDYEGSMIEALKIIKDSNKKQLKKYKEDFVNGMRRSYDLLGKNAFRKLQSNGNYSGINRALFECTSVSLALLSVNYYKRINKMKFEKKYIDLLHDEKFISSISNATFNENSIETRYDKIKKLLEKSYD